MDDEKRRHAQAEIDDSFDEELEMELDNERLSGLLDEGSEAEGSSERHAYFRRSSSCSASSYAFKTGSC
jgi:hypothetical protein